MKYVLVLVWGRMDAHIGKVKVISEICSRVTSAGIAKLLAYSLPIRLHRITVAEDSEEELFQCRCCWLGSHLQVFKLVDCGIGICGVRLWW